MEQPEMEYIGTVQSLHGGGGLSSVGMTLTPLSEAQPNVHAAMDMTMTRLNIQGSGDANGTEMMSSFEDSSNNGTGNYGGISWNASGGTEVTDALTFFGKKDKSSSLQEGGAFGGGEFQIDDGDSKGFWGQGGQSKATMPVHRDSEVYNMSHAKRGRALILNHENFHPTLDLGRRFGTERDKTNLVVTLKNLGFEVTAKDDMSYHEVADEIKKLTQEDHSKHDCLLIVVLSHGDTQLLYAKDFSYKPDMIWQSFTADKVPSLAGKPKMFLIQACQGCQLDEGTKLVRVNRTETDSNPQSYKIPNHADFLIAFSTVPGFYSWRNTTNGSWFIQAVCSVFGKYATKKDVLSMMTIVAREVALSFESNTPSQPHMNQKKQIPFITSTLIRDVYLVPK